MTLPNRAATCDHDESIRSADADLELWLTHLRQAMDRTGWTIDALAAHWHQDRSYVWKLVHNEKPWSKARELSLPDDLEGCLAAIRAEYFGRIVVEPLTGLEAQKAIVAGLIGLMSSPLPAKADRMARAEIAPDPKAVKR